MGRGGGGDGLSFSLNWHTSREPLSRPTSIGGEPLSGQTIPREDFRDWINHLRLDAKFRWPPFRAYYRYRSHKYARREPVLGLLRFLADPARASLDIGANLGLHTYLLARHSRTVHAFEPNPIPLRILRKVADKNVEVHPMAVSDRTGEADLTVWKSRKGWTSNGAHLDSRETDHRTVTLKVPCTRLDDLVCGDIGFIKIDVEGHELAVLKGAEHTIHRHRPNVVLENEFVHVGEKMQDVFDLMAGYDYDAFAVFKGVLRNVNGVPAIDFRAGPPLMPKDFVFLPRR